MAAPEGEIKVEPKVEVPVVEVKVPEKKVEKKEALPGCPIRKPLGEEELGKRMDVCIANVLVKTGAGFGIGALASFVLFKRRPWPMIFGTGLGLGLSFGNCKSYMEGQCPMRPPMKKPVPVKPVETKKD